jgi:hypothetical protein
VRAVLLGDENGDETLASNLVHEGPERLSMMSVCAKDANTIDEQEIARLEIQARRVREFPEIGLSALSYANWKDVGVAVREGKTEEVAKSIELLAVFNQGDQQRRLGTLTLSVQPIQKVQPKRGLPGARKARKQECESAFSDLSLDEWALAKDRFERSRRFQFAT